VRAGRRRIGATYRLQLAGRSFRDIVALVPYLSSLGIETLYLSPILHARTGSSHGYDVVDPGELDPALGTPADFEEMLSSLADAGLNVLLDVVPNHQAASEDNPSWQAALAAGREGPGGRVFDIDWDSAGGRVVLPVLARPLVDVLADGEISLRRRRGEVVLSAGDRFFPLADGSVQGDASALVASFEELGEDVAARYLESILAQQHYRLSYWRSARDEVNYRRFFDVNDLVAVRLEDEGVYTATHRFLLELARDERIAGFRVDHIDGLADPAGYLARLRRDLNDIGEMSPLVFVEKILARSESLEADWDVDGTTGYDFAAAAGGLFVDAGGADAIASSMARLTGDERSFAERVVEAKRQVLEELFAGQLDRVARTLAAATACDRAAGDLSLRSIRQASAALIAALGVYRTYAAPGRPLSPAGIERVKEAGQAAESQLDAEGRRALGVISALVVNSGRPGTGEDGDGAAAAVAGLQQLSGAVMAKGGEDTAAYNAGRLLATVEVGSDPDDAARRLDDFHEAMSDRLLRTPMALSATSTHDSKRSEDLRSRLAVLSEMPARWSASLETFRAVNAPHRCQRGAGDVPDAAEETYLYETLVGSFPLSGEVSTEYVARIEQHMEKAVREAKRHSSWTDPNEHYESLVRHFVSSVLSPANGVFLSLLGQLSNEIGPAGAANSLGLCLLRVVAPGVPDTYQGTERWSLALVDPDNRRYVDLSEAASVLDNLDYFDDLGSGLSSSSLLSTWEDGRVKLAVLARSLRLRRAHAGTFEDGAYLPLAATGVGGEHVIAFARIAVDHFAVAAAVRKTRTLAGPGRFAVGSCFADGALVLPAGEGPLTDVLTGRRLEVDRGWIALSELFAELPVALLSSDVPELHAPAFM
jgi:malto-oligosyltrehalose synthase